jgi:hypothetical protein
LIPDNLVELNDEVMKADPSKFTPQEIEEAKALLGQIPAADESIFTVHDYRTIGLGVEVASPNVMELSAIIASARVQGVAEAVASTPPA